MCTECVPKGAADMKNQILITSAFHLHRFLDMMDRI
jgi:uncharacterized SAM-binding protein YcdF (DUF218 family)